MPAILALDVDCNDESIETSSTIYGMTMNVGGYGLVVVVLACYFNT